ncbi:PQQ-dependent sugar dehydrogenase [Chryseolinea lacunae]|uniref:PQQ-dependent sugar dehydrogenase n=1 Tax=Chryseolinea lacunae TaxID=2801331 RepID=A0ABS1KVD3_9BACT|nr:PQQ-dependent sugar dehydrogenase [Chryseolinea lacunae]MBL0743433.1 PQQ-dependent sugar dehydrogenase [Chryseolinea lacunae]
MTRFFLSSKRTRTISSLLLFALTAFTSCTKNKDDAPYLSSAEAIHQGEALFEKHCSACHNFRLDGIGPNLAGVTHDTLSKAWIAGFINNSQSYMDRKEFRALDMKENFKVTMPSFAHLKADEVDNLLAYINTKHKRLPVNHYDTLTAIKDPFPDSIPMADLRVDLELITQMPASTRKGVTFEGLQTRITKFQSAPRGGFYVVDLRGTLYLVENGKTQPYLDMTKEKPAFVSEPGMATGFGSFAFHPEFNANGLLYTAHTEPPRSKPADFTFADSIPSTVQWVVTEWKTTTPDKVPFSGTSREIFRAEMVTGMHGMQELTFNPNAKPKDEDYGLLYIGIGDAGCVEHGFPFLVGNERCYLGSIFRIDPLGTNSKNGHYGIPASNPFVKEDGAVKEIFAYGFRNPHRLTWLRSGEMLAGNIGQHHVEAVYRVQKGKNHGWPIREGSFAIDTEGDINRAYPLPANDSINGLVYPVVQYDHDEGFAMVGGFEYTGKAIPAFAGKYILGDIAKGKLFITDVAQLRNAKLADLHRLHVRLNGKETTLLSRSGLSRVDMRLGRDAQGELYVLTKYDGKIYKIVKAEKVK